MKHKCKKIRAGQYLYRGVTITYIGYYPPEQKEVWEGSINLGGDYRGFTLKEIKQQIDDDLDV